MKKWIRNGCFQRIFTIFAKNTAHNERRLKKMLIFASWRRIRRRHDL